MPLLPFNRNFSTGRSPTQLATLVLSRPPAISRVAHSQASSHSERIVHAVKVRYTLLTDW
jgi:hypothetical protein